MSRQENEREGSDELEWAGRPVAVGDVVSELSRAWREAPRPDGNNSAPLATRTNVLNLIVFTSTRAEAATVAALVARLGVHHPSRTVIVLAEPDAPDSSVKAWVTTQRHTMKSTGRRLAFEQVTIEAPGVAARSLPTIVDPLLISELPNFLWWLGDPPFHSPTFHQLIDIVDRLIVNSAAFHDLERAFQELGELVVIPYGAKVSDFAWGRLRPWRELVAQFFDPPALAPSLPAIETVEIVYEPEATDGNSALSQAILALGWLCSRLGWQAQTPPRRSGDESLSWTLLSAGRQIDATLIARHEDDGVSGMRSLTLTAGGDAPGVFQVYREGMGSLATSVAVADVPHPDRLARAVVREESDLLLRDLNQFDRDRIYEGALVFAAQLCRGLQEARR